MRMLWIAVGLVLALTAKGVESAPSLSRCFKFFHHIKAHSHGEQSDLKFENDSSLLDKIAAHDSIAIEKSVALIPGVPSQMAAKIRELSELIPNDARTAELVLDHLKTLVGENSFEAQQAQALLTLSDRELSQVELPDLVSFNMALTTVLGQGRKQANEILEQDEVAEQLAETLEDLATPRASQSI